MPRLSRVLGLSLALMLPFVAASHQLEPVVFEALRTPLLIRMTDATVDGSESSRQIFSSGTSQPLERACTRFMIVGTEPNAPWSAEARVRDPGGVPTEWVALERRVGDGGRFWARLLRDIPARSTIEFRVLAAPGSIAPAAAIQIQLVYAVPVEEEGTESASTQDVHPEAPALFPGCLTSPELISRDQWGAVPPVGTQIPHTPFRFTLHHTAMSRCTTLAEGITEVRFIQDLHINGNGWKDIGYHFLVDDSGRVYAGVPDSIVGTHTGNANTGNIGISMMGLFSNVRPPEPMVAAVEQLSAYLTEKFGCNPDSLFGHRDYVTTTECPGDSGYALLVPLRDAIRRDVACGGPYITDPYPQPFSRNIDVNTAIHFHLHDDQEGVNPSTVKIFINGIQRSPTGVSGNPTHYYVLYRFAVPFQTSHEVVVTIQAEDQAQPPNTLDYTYRFTTQTPAIVAETMLFDSMSNAHMELLGVWLEQPFKAVVPGVSGTSCLVTYGFGDSVSARIYPLIARSGNYAVTMATGAMVQGMNFRFRCVSSDGRIIEQTAEYNQTFWNVWGPLGRGPVFLAEGSPSTGYIELLPAYNHPSILILDALKFEERDSLEAPSLVDLQYVVRSVGGEVAVGWQPSLDHKVCGYRIYLSPDGRTWGAPTADEASLAGEDSVWHFLPPDAEAPVYVRIAAVKCLGADSAGGPPAVSEGPPSDTYGISLRGQSRILVVDNFDRQASWSAPTHFFVRSYGDAIASYGAGFESCANDAVAAGTIHLDDYDAVIYLCGDDSERDESVSETELLMLKTYLDGGGKLFISGSEIGYDLGRPGRPDEYLFGYLFRAGYLGDDAGVHACEGVAGTLFQGLTFDYGAETSETYIEDWPDFIIPRNLSAGVLLYQGTDKVAAVAYTGPMASLDTVGGAGKLSTGAGDDSIASIVYCAFPVETILTPEARAEVVGRVLTYFSIPSVPLAVPGEGVPLTFSLLQNFPNPFNPVTTLRFSIADRQMATLKVYDLLGREVATLVNEPKESGTYTVVWDASGLASGVYVYRLQAGPFVATRKMVLVR